MYVIADILAWLALASFAIVLALLVVLVLPVLAVAGLVLNTFTRR